MTIYRHNFDSSYEYYSFIQDDNGDVHNESILMNKQLKIFILAFSLKTEQVCFINLFRRKGGWV